jgi:hypothetical protein
LQAISAGDRVRLRPMETRSNGHLMMSASIHVTLGNSQEAPGIICVFQARVKTENKKAKGLANGLLLLREAPTKMSSGQHGSSRI